MSSNGTPKDPDDFFADTRMTFGDHLEDLRTHLWRAIAGFGVALCLSFFIGHLVVNLITAPVKKELTSFYERRTRKLLKDLKDDTALQQLNQATPFSAVLIPRK